ncbi:serine/threonine-protein kinase [Aetokthonos hydrillicola Thurmond2011]|jgi:CHASE2 domain-containing sensor protein/tRNA A-37 threonylcarbamoyl transferase component Bud32|uniref:non-specific serine/threonine protein kinase n=1 Tax=Aetokthonos hydrillicola Thurmond2011 TaxID=2712845 RepID=A0AAP5I6W5_9CYAN|nr:serine/threonine-protein kinase [Aetokthonos hydrillicola]MBO3463331.1 CHASE2 domain-containing protein [Aetokthonos hydrillicola CCALA 1050]MBW4586800.1 CHASE2 domain-containing protein [Aetokthonos hydrillicola CCALA 1050]MDR9895840.1 serine/threonine-protein kinase [Aetokthonos hydrillicola Thurmond2011]
MGQKSTSSLTKKYVSATHRQFSNLSKATVTGLARSPKFMARLGHGLNVASALGAAMLATSSLTLPQFMESQAQTFFYLIRGPLTPTRDIVILAIDDQSISVPAQYYKTNPQQYAYWEPLKAFPFKREAYAQVTERLIKSGAKSVAIDVLFDTPSSYGKNDDEKLRQLLQRYGSQVTLAALYENTETENGSVVQLKGPQQMFLTGSVSIGLVNFPLGADGTIRKLASEFPKLLGDAVSEKLPSFDEAVLRASQVNYPQPKGNQIYFQGPAGTFEVIPFSYVLDPQNWDTYLQQGKIFKDKIVLIGATTKLSTDYHPVAASGSWLSPQPMSGVEIHANAIATLIEDRTIQEILKSGQARGLFVLGLVGGCGVIVARKKQGIIRLYLSLALATLWGAISYILFVYAQLILPAAVPVLALATIGLCYMGTEVAKEVFRKSQLLDVFQKYASHHVVREILSQQDDLKDLLQQREMAISGKLLDGRYKIIKVLGSGGFSETYIAEDTRLPGNPLCVVKQLKPAHSKPDQLIVARRLFNSEAQTLQKLGRHNQIPQLLAYFEEEEEFYLVQEYIVGHALSQELPTGKRIPETTVIKMLRDLLEILAFVHQNGVIHRDIKPSNIIRRDSDGKLVLIDFGAVKEVSTQILDNQEQTSFTISIGTKGYAPTEQCYGRPQYSSDIYAVGIIGIKALTGKAPHELERDGNGELIWSTLAEVSKPMAKILSKMVLENFQQRYQSASIALEALNKLIALEGKYSLSTDDLTIATISLEDDSYTPTTPWTGVTEQTPDSPPPGS